MLPGLAGRREDAQRRLNASAVAGENRRIALISTIRYGRLILDRTFDATRFVRDVGRDLIAEFENARRATTPELVGSAMEAAARNRLEQILPSEVAVGTGCVIDTYGNTSSQIDIILYERQVCPVFRVNYNDPKSTYYPCEGVIAVGEVKSVIGKKELEDSFRKIASVKSLRRNFDYPKYPDYNGRRVLGYRKYGERAGAIRNDIISSVNYAPNSAEGSKIYGFILADKRATTIDTLKKHYLRLINIYDGGICPNTTVFLEGTAFDPACAKDRKFINMLSVEMAWCILVRKLSSPFSVLVSRLHSAYNLGGTAETEVFGQYYLKPEEEEIELVGLFPIKGYYILIDDLYDDQEVLHLSCTSCRQGLHHGDGSRLLDAKQFVCGRCIARQ